ncbi:hypothetical protein [Spongiactinospora sp. TRM90649]|uniref:hypothetical protein n=1 Tax=Spongiactinospora sp. TRM90649 TaxID=3031114 RepID=UPI0023F8736D|nr:hypothetical protein [Spongiactinospora sp. TRM90649]MDF5752574.1 hypothetical protein [Spongiactinospora sp. TRM90649]
MRRRRRGFTREELAQSAALTVAVLLVLGLLAAWSVLIPGVDAWENIVVAMIGSLRLTGPVAAAFAAWVAMRKRRATARRPQTPWRAMKAPLAIMAVVAVSFAVTALLFAVRTVLTEQAGKLPPSALAMGMAGLALYVSIGWVAGWALPYAITPALAGVSCYALFTWLVEGSTWAERLAPATREPYDVFQGLSGAAFTDQTLWLVGASTALMLGWAATVTRQGLLLGASLCAVLAAGAGLVRLAGAPAAGAAAQPVAYSCQEWPITICVHPGMRNGLTDLGAAFTKIASRLTGTPAEFTRVEQRPRRPDGGLSPGVVPVHVDDLETGFADRAAEEFLDSLAGHCANGVPRGYREIVMAWLRGEPLPGGPLPEHQYAAAWFSGLTEAQRREWLRMFYADFTACSLRAEHFGGGPHAVRAEGPARDRPTPAYPSPAQSPRAYLDHPVKSAGPPRPSAPPAAPAPPVVKADGEAARPPATAKLARQGPPDDPGDPPKHQPPKHGPDHGQDHGPDRGPARGPGDVGERLTDPPDGDIGKPPPTPTEPGDYRESRWSRQDRNYPEEVGRAT